MRSFFRQLKNDSTTALSEQLLLMLGSSFWAWMAPPAAVLQPCPALLVEPVDPVSQRLTANSASPRRQPTKLAQRIAALDLDDVRDGGHPPSHVESHQD